MATDARFLPLQLVQSIELWIDKEFADAEKWDNRDLLDDSGVFTLYRLAAEIYAAGFAAGECAADERLRGVARRARKRAASSSAHPMEETKQ